MRAAYTRAKFGNSRAQSPAACRGCQSSRLVYPRGPTGRRHEARHRWRAAPLGREGREPRARPDRASGRRPAAPPSCVSLQPVVAVCMPPPAKLAGSATPRLGFRC